MRLAKKIEDDIKSVHENFYQICKSKLPKRLRNMLVLVVLCVSFILLFGCVIIFSGQVKSAWNTLWEKDNAAKKSYAPETTSYLTGLINDIIERNPSVLGASTDFTQWENYGKFDLTLANNSLLCPSYSRAFPEGRTMYSTFSINSSFKTVFEFKPSSINRENIVFEFRDVFRCIIGNGNYKHIACEDFPYGGGYLIEENQKHPHAWINRPSGVKPSTIQFLTVVTDPVFNSEVLNINLGLKFIPADSVTGEYKTQSFEYNIPTGNPAETLNKQIGLGIIDPYRFSYGDDEACAQFISFELE